MVEGADLATPRDGDDVLEPERRPAATTWWASRDAHPDGITFTVGAHPMGLIVSPDRCRGVQG
jgi:hypothetical protein